MFHSADSLDDLLREMLPQIKKSGHHIDPGKGAATELTGVLLELTNPRARLSQTETRGKPFSSLGELCWYLAASGDLGFMKYYISNYTEFSEGDPVFGAYGPRLFSWCGIDQISNIIDLLKNRPDSRRAVIQIFAASDLAEYHREVPCTCTLQMLLRSGKLHMIANMRSNDIHSGIVHDVFAFTMLQEIVARSISVELGTYKHMVGSLHLYEEDEAAASQFLREGWQSTIAMPPMPSEEPWPAIHRLVEGEAELRTTGQLRDSLLEGLDPYWADLIRLLQAFRARKDGDQDKIKEIRQHFVSPAYEPFIDGLAAREI